MTTSRGGDGSRGRILKTVGLCPNSSSQLRNSRKVISFIIAVNVVLILAPVTAEILIIQNRSYVSTAVT